jgi:dCMP deaminase
MTRVTWDEYFIQMLDAVAQRATCNRGRSGAILVLDRQILATGYVGSPPGFPHCDVVGHQMVRGHCFRTVHAEQNALVSAARRGVAIENSVLYSTMVPCRVCAMLIVTAGINHVVAATAYQNSEGLSVLQAAGIECLIVKDIVPYDPA